MFSIYLRMVALEIIPLNLIPNFDAGKASIMFSKQLDCKCKS